MGEFAAFLVGLGTPIIVVSAGVIGFMGGWRVRRTYERRVNSAYRVGKTRVTAHVLREMGDGDADATVSALERLSLNGRGA